MAYLHTTSSDPDQLIGMMIGMGNIEGAEKNGQKLQTFQGVAGGDEEQARFYLEAANWNLDVAISNFYEQQQASNGRARGFGGGGGGFGSQTRNNLTDFVEFHATFIKDVSIPEWTEFAPNTPFIKTWRFRNTGVSDWPVGTAFSFRDGELMSAPYVINLDSAVPPDEDVDVSINMMAPADVEGRCQGSWQLLLPSGERLSEVVYCCITVNPNMTTEDLVDAVINSMHDTEVVNESKTSQLVDYSHLNHDDGSSGWGGGWGGNGGGNNVDMDGGDGGGWGGSNNNGGGGGWSNNNDNNGGGNDDDSNNNSGNSGRSWGGFGGRNTGSRWGGGGGGWGNN